MRRAGRSQGLRSFMARAARFDVEALNGMEREGGVMAGYRQALTAAIGLALLGGCAAQVPSAEVTRFHVGQPIDRSAIAIQARDPASGAGLEFESFASAVGRELRGQGFSIVPAQGQGGLVALIDVSRSIRPLGEPRSRFSIGLGGGSYGGGIGIGGGVQIPVGKKSGAEAVRTELFVQIRRRDGDQALWEGRAQIEARSGTPYASPAAAVDKLATALFKGFPGESGRTITVP